MAEIILTCSIVGIILQGIILYKIIELVRKSVFEMRTIQMENNELRFENKELKRINVQLLDLETIDGEEMTLDVLFNKYEEGK